MDSQMPSETPAEPASPQPPSPPPQPPPPSPPQPPGPSAGAPIYGQSGPPRPPAPPYPPPYYYGPPPRRTSPWLLGCGIASAGCLFLILLLFALGLFAVIGAVGSMGGMVEMENREAEIALIRIEGVITAGASSAGLFGGAIGSDEIVRQIERAQKNDNIKAILLRVNSPGGSAAGSQEIYNAVVKARKSGKTVVVSMADVAASGGYYISAPADKIYADPATMTGSIGVIAMHEDLSGLFGKIGVRTETLKSGELKDMFSPYGPLTEQARAVMKTMLMQVYEQFINAVSRGRDMTVAEVKALADGRIYTGEQAVANGLADELGGLREALDGAAKLSGASSSAYQDYSAPSLLRLLMGSQTRSQGIQARLPEGLLYDGLAARLAWGEPGLPDLGQVERR